MNTYTDLDGIEREEPTDEEAAAAAEWLAATEREYRRGREKAQHGYASRNEAGEICILESDPATGETILRRATEYEELGVLSVWERREEP